MLQSCPIVWLPIYTDAYGITLCYVDQYLPYFQYCNAVDFIWILLLWNDVAMSYSEQWIVPGVATVTSWWYESLLFHSIHMQAWQKHLGMGMHNNSRSSIIYSCMLFQFDLLDVCKPTVRCSLRVGQSANALDWPLSSHLACSVME